MTKKQMADNTIGEILKSKSKEVDPLVSEVSIFKQLIRERAHPLDLVRELLSNSGATEVGASHISISYTKDREGHIFEIDDDGCGMDYRGNLQLPGRLDKFLGLGLSGIIGIKADEFSWKGLGSKLAFQSRRVEIETCRGENFPHYSVLINEPWSTIDNNNVPRPRITEHPTDRKSTKIRVVGHPPHRQEEPFTFSAIKTFLQHRTFAGYTQVRNSHPEISLSVLGQTATIPFGFPEFKGIDFAQFRHDGLRLDEDSATLFVNMQPAKSKTKPVTVKGFITWKADRFELAPASLNTGLILSVKGIPYCSLPMEDYGVTTIRTARPGKNKGNYIQSYPLQNHPRLRAGDFSKYRHTFLGEPSNTVFNTFSTVSGIGSGNSCSTGLPRLRLVLIGLSFSFISHPCRMYPRFLFSRLKPDKV